MGNIIKIKATKNGKFTILNNEILRCEELSFTAKALFWQMWSFNEETWQLNINGLANVTNLGKNTVQKCIKELIQVGYVERQEKFTHNGKQTIYYLYESLEDKKILQGSNLQGSNLQGSNLQGSKSDLNKTLNNKTPNIIKHQIDKTYPKNSFLGEIEGQEDLINKNMDTCYMDSQNSLVKNNQIKETRGARVKTSAQIKKEARRMERKKKQEIKIEQEQNKEMKSAADFAEMTLEDQTIEEGILANAKRLNNAAQEKLNEANRRSGRKSAVKTRITSLIEHEIKDAELRELLKSFVSMWIEVGKKMTEEVYTQQIKTLTELSSDLNIQKEIVKRSIQHAWLGFYPLQSDKSKNDKIIKPAPVFSQEAELARDENGNILLY